MLARPKNTSAGPGKPHTIAAETMSQSILYPSLACAVSSYNNRVRTAELQQLQLLTFRYLRNNALKEAC
jgi:hypothetical protein